MKLSKESFQYFKGIYELKDCGWIVSDEYYDEVVQPQLDLMKNAIYRTEFAFKCLYPNEKPLSKEDYSRTRYTHRKILQKRDTLMQVRTESENESFQKFSRKMKIEKGIYPLGISFDEAMENEEIKRYYEKGLYKKGSFVARHIVPLHNL